MSEHPAEQPAGPSAVPAPAPVAPPSKVLVTALVAGGGLAAAGFLTFVEPGSTNPLAALYVTCPSRTLLGVACPLCGGTRAAQALLRGEVREMARLNLVLPVLVVLGAWAWLASMTRDAVRWRVPAIPRRRWLWGTLGVLFVAYGVLRNLPWSPFTALAP